MILYTRFEPKRHRSHLSLVNKGKNCLGATVEAPNSIPRVWKTPSLFSWGRFVVFYLNRVHPIVLLDEMRDVNVPKELFYDTGNK